MRLACERGKRLNLRQWAGNGPDNFGNVDLCSV
jgi:hypothetical protein